MAVDKEQKARIIMFFDANPHRKEAFVYEIRNMMAADIPDNTIKREGVNSLHRHVINETVGVNDATLRSVVGTYITRVRKGKW